jgi:S-methylmethionine-dependent homocysteine/selenocysteine methylase
MINKTKTEEDLRNLKGMSIQPKVQGFIGNLWFHSLRNRYPFEYLLFSQDNNNQDYYKNQIKAKIVGLFNKKIDLIVSGTLTQESVDELNSMLIKLQEFSIPNLSNESKTRYARNN